MKRATALGIAAALAAITTGRLQYKAISDPAQSKPRRERNTGAAKAKRQAKRSKRK